MMFEPHAKDTISATFDYTSSKGTPALLGFIGGEQAYYWNQQPVCFVVCFFFGGAKSFESFKRVPYSKSFR